MSRRTLVLAVSVCGVVLAGCSPVVEDEAGDDILQEPVDPDGPARADATADPGRSPAPGECLELPRDAQGDFTVLDAGTASVESTDGELAVGEVEAAEGWEHEVVTEEAEEVVIVFTGEDGGELELRVEPDGSEATAEVCSAP